MMLAFLCAGQGFQHRDMFRAIGDAPEARPILEAATETLGADPRRFVHEASEDALFENRAGQILIVTMIACWWAVLRPSAAIVAGYSVGDLAAWGCAGMVPLDALPGLASSRAALMDRAAPEGAGLAAITGLARDVIHRLCAAHGVEIAIDNSARSVVVGGRDAALAAFVAAARAAGATHAAPLRVRVPSHTSLLADARAPFAERLAEARPASPAPGIRLIAGLDGDRVRGAADGIPKLAAALCTTIDWAACLDACVEAGASRILELGPGHALARMMTARAPDIASRSTDDFRSLPGARDWLAMSS